MRNAFFAACAALLILAPAALADWSENFDSYALGSGLDGQGNWECWEAGTGTDGYVTDDQNYSSPHSAAIISTTDIVQPFAESGGTWTMEAWCYVPTGSTGDQYFIMLNQYYPDTNNWSVQLQFASDEGNVIDYYSSSTTPIINDQWVKVELDIYLDLNSYDIYYNDTFLASNTWQSGGSDAIAALDLFSDGGSTIYWDDLDLEQGGALQHTTWGNIKTIMQ
jgi:hypothetical protein